MVKGSERRQGSAARRHRSRSRSRDRSSRGDSPRSRGTDTEDGEMKEPCSPMRAGPLSARQQARVADLSLLLDVILKTNYYKYVKCSTIVWCTAPGQMFICKHTQWDIHADAVLDAQIAVIWVHCAYPRERVCFCHNAIPSLCS